jgi:hypothetical protein
MGKDAKSARRTTQRAHPAQRPGDAATQPRAIWLPSTVGPPRKRPWVLAASIVGLLAWFGFVLVMALFY